MLINDDDNTFRVWDADERVGLAISRTLSDHTILVSRGHTLLPQERTFLTQETTILYLLALT
jgi:hypothetical protein